MGLVKRVTMAASAEARPVFVARGSERERGRCGNGPAAVYTAHGRSEGIRRRGTLVVRAAGAPARSFWSVAPIRARHNKKRYGNANLATNIPR